MQRRPPVGAGEPPPRPGRQQPQRQKHDDTAARPELPPVEADLPDRPAQRADDDRRVEPKRDGFAPVKQPGGDQEAETGDDVVPAAAERRQPDAAAAENQTDESKDHGGEDGCHNDTPSGAAGERPKTAVSKWKRSPLSILFHLAAAVFRPLARGVKLAGQYVLILRASFWHLLWPCCCSR